MLSPGTRAPGRLAFPAYPPEHPVPPPVGQHQLPPEPPWRLLVPAVHASAGVTDEAVPWAVAQAMPTVPSLGHAPLRPLLPALRKIAGHTRSLPRASGSRWKAAGQWALATGSASRVVTSLSASVTVSVTVALAVWTWWT